MFEEIVAFKLTNGHEIIGKLKSESDSVYDVEDAMHLFAEPTDSNNIGLRFVPITFFAKQKSNAKDGMFLVSFALQKSHVLVKYEPLPEVQRSYFSATSTIVLPN